MTFNEMIKKQGDLYNKVDDLKSANEYRELWIKLELEQDEAEALEMAEEMVRGLKVKVEEEGDDMVFYFETSTGDYEDFTYERSDSYSYADCLDKLYEEAPYLAFCELV